MSDIEKEFFEAFGMEPKTEVTQIGESLGFCNTTIRKLYPSITSDIILGLERIILDNQGNIIYLMELLDDYYCLCGDDYQYPTNEGRGTTRLNALLQLCIELKSEISEEVKALFKC